MVQRRADEAKEYRARKKAQMGETQYLAEQAKKRRERRARNRANPVIENKESCESLLDALYQAKNKMAKKKGRSIKKASVKGALDKINRIYKYMTGKTHDCKDFEWARNTDEVYKFIMGNKGHPWKTAETKQQHLQALSSILIAIRGFEDEYKFYSKASIENRKGITKDTDESKLTENERKNILPWSQIKNLFAIVADSRDRALIGVYTLIAPRRNKDFGLMKIKHNEEGLSKDWNYIVVDEKNRPTKFIFNNYKTQKIFGTQEFSIPATLKTILQKYIREYDYGDNDVLFGDNRGNPYKNFSNVVSSTFKKYTNKALSVNLLRHSFISDFLNKPKLTMKERKEVAEAMAHSVMTALKYSRVDILENTKNDKD